MTRLSVDEYRKHLHRQGFELGERIGSGSFGTVYKAKQPSLDRVVAVKFYDSRLRRGDANERRFQRETPLLARVQHPAIPYVITRGEVTGGGGTVPYLVMEYVKGTPLSRRIDAGTPMQPGEIFGVMRDVLSALSGAHQHQVVHRDVKPDNILLADRTTYLIDFSIGICLDMEGDRARATRTGEGLGTANYAAPEQVQDAANADHRSDVYSAGVVLAEMLGARPPLKLVELARELPSVSPSLKAVVRRACAPAPAERYQNADEFLADLDAQMGPRASGILDAQLVICPNMACSGVARSEGGSYIFGPKITGPTTDPFCANCGTEYIRGCSTCRLPLPDNIASLISKPTKPSPDALGAYCARCSSVIFVTPTCLKCKSYLKSEDIGKDTTGGCSKCAPKARGSAYGAYGGTYGGADSDPAEEDDIPF